MLHRCFSSSLLARIFLGKPGLLPSSEDGGDGSCAAIIIPERACDLPNAEMKPSSAQSFGLGERKTSAVSKHAVLHDLALSHDEPIEHHTLPRAAHARALSHQGYRRTSQHQNRRLSRAEREYTQHYLHISLLFRTARFLKPFPCLLSSEQHNLPSYGPTN